MANSAAEDGSVIPAPAPPGGGKQDDSTLTDVALKVFGAVGTGIGILGFITFFGGAIIWLRADKAELPATEAVAVIPRSVLIVTGATFLFPAALIASGVVAVVFLIDLIFYLTRQRGLRTVRAQAKTFGREAAQLTRSAIAAQQSWRAAEATLEKRQQNLSQAFKREAPGSEITELETAVEEQQIEAGRLQAAAEGAVSAATNAKMNADDLAEESEVELRRTTFQWVVELSVAAVALLLAVPLCNGAIGHIEEVWEPVVLVLAAVSGTAFVLSVYVATEKFIWFGIVAFVAIGVYLAAATYISTHRNAKMQPVAALWSGHAPVTGAFVADTSQSFYIGTFREKGQPPTLVVIPRAEVRQVAIGPLLDQPQARRRAIQMALDQCAQKVKSAQTEQPGEKSKSGKSATQWEPACTPAQIEGLSQQLAEI